MNMQTAAYFLFGLSMVIIFGVIIVYYYSKKRQKKIEEPKFRMLDDDR
ncbi:MAG: cbb3-type cytochrome c oxidase subunit 3 [Thermodesulfovibrionia bacterium]|nr:cbb3-type cytochrome c oxidase subunit 3 [Thermodesulfovibrionia bacterium]